jgi:pimeloyl-ACP methyl ester carboxylesterase
MMCDDVDDDHRQNPITSPSSPSSPQHFCCVTQHQHQQPAAMTTSSKPDRIVKYRIPGDETGGRLFLFGNPNAQRMIFFCAGYPDDHSAFSPLAARLAKELDAFCGVTCLAGYDDCVEKPWASSFRPQGYSFEELVQALRTGAKVFRQESTNSTDDKVVFTTVFHDWGSVVGSIYTNRVMEEKDSFHVPDQIVYFDILPLRSHKNEPNRPQPQKHSMGHLVKESAYRMVFALAFFFYHHLASKQIGILIARLGGLLLRFVATASDMAMDRFHELSPSRLVYMMFPYQAIIMDISKSKYYKTPSILKGFHLPILQEVPVLFLYGASKPLQMHDQNVADFMHQHEGKSDSIGVQNAGHWLYLHQPDECLDAVRKFIESE